MDEAKFGELRRYLFQDFLDSTTECRGAGARSYSCFCVIQGGGAKGAWQGAVINSLMDSREIEPKGAVGSSAGAINAWLISSKIDQPDKNPFLCFWLKTPMLAWISIVFLVIPGTLKFFLLKLIRLFNLHKKLGNRFWPLVPHKLFSRFFKCLLPEGYSRIFTYVQVTNIDSPEPPALRDDGHHPLFYFKPGDRSSRLAWDRKKILYYEAIATSSSLPSVEPLELEGINYADGGIYSNLPINSVFASGTVGTDFVVCLCPVPLSELKPESDYVHYRMLALLHELKNDQVQSGISFLDCQVVHGHPLAPIFIIQPEKVLSSGTVGGFLLPHRLLKDVCVGKRDASAFLKSLRDCNRHPDRLKKHLLIEIALPVLPPRAPPLRAGWVDWVNFGWREDVRN